MFNKKSFALTSALLGGALGRNLKTEGAGSVPAAEPMMAATPEDDRLLLPIQTPTVTGLGRNLVGPTNSYIDNYVTIEFKSGPGVGGEYSLACYTVDEPTDVPRSCADLDGVAPEASVAPQDLPKIYGNVANNVTGVYSEAVDCYVFSEWAKGTASTCEYIDRVTGFDAYVAYNDVTIKCPGIDLTSTPPEDSAFTLNGNAYNKETTASLRTITDGTDVAVMNAALKAACTTDVVDMSRLFFKDTPNVALQSMNAEIGSWDMSSVQTIYDMFLEASSFNQPIGIWNTSSVRSMIGTFNGAAAFNQPIGDWNTSLVTNMSYMFRNATDFNQPIGSWDTGMVENMGAMFDGATDFNQDLSSWDVADVNAAGGTACQDFCANSAGFTLASQIPAFSGCGITQCP